MGILFASNTIGVRSAGPLQKGSRGVEWASSEFCDSDFKSKLGLLSVVRMVPWQRIDCGGLWDVGGGQNSLSHRRVLFVLCYNSTRTLTMQGLGFREDGFVEQSIYLG